MPNQSTLFHLGAALLLVSFTALAQSQPTSTPTNTPTSTPASPTSIPAALTAAADLFASGDYNAAVKLFEAAQGAGTRDPIVWFYIARCREALNEPHKALKAYQQYVKLAPKAPDTPAVRLKISELEASLPPVDPASQPKQADETEEPQIPVDTERDYSARTKLGHASMALGGMTSLLGLMFSAVSRDRVQFIEEAEPGTPFDETLQQFEREAKRFHNASLVCFSLGGTMFVGGLVAALTAPKPQKVNPQNTDLTFWIVPSETPSAGVRLRW